MIMNVTERFLKYVSFDTRSDPESAAHPTTTKQLILGKYIAQEMTEMGLSDVYMSENGYVYGVLPASEGMEDFDCIGLVAHMDTSPDVTGENVRACIVEYTGGDVVLNEEKGIVMRAAEFEHLSNYFGKHLIVTDGTTLLGADDKAGIAEIMTVMDYLVSNPEIKHGRIPVCITPDEEVGQGADFFDIERFGADYAYTVDGGALGEIEYENFNAASAKITFSGINIHPGDAKNKMKNAALIAAEFVGLLPASQTPACTEGYEGFFHLCDMSGSEESARLAYIIRDHDMQKFCEKKTLMESCVSFINAKYGDGTAALEMKDSYYNMREKIEPVMHIVDRAVKAMKDSGVEPVIVPIRGGTDGARLSYMGLPCPNLSTGGHNFHGRYEYIPVESMEKMVEVLFNLLTM